MYSEFGIGSIEINLNRALEWYIKGAEQNHKLAALNGIELLRKIAKKESTPLPELLIMKWKGVAGEDYSGWRESRDRIEKGYIMIIKS